MSESGEKPRSVVAEIRPFDPRLSAEAATRALDALQAPYALIGGLALDAWGIARATKDLDLAVPVGIAEAAGKAFEGVKTVPLRIGGLGIRDQEGNLYIDLIDRRFHFAALYGDAIEEAQQASRLVKIGESRLPLVSLEYLLAMKLVSGEPKDDADVRRILEHDDLRYKPARKIVEKHLGTASANRLDAMAREMGHPEAPRRYGENGGILDGSHD